MSHSIQPRADDYIEPPGEALETSLQSLLQELRTRGDGQGSLIGASLGSAVEAVWANRMRSLLTRNTAAPTRIFHHRQGCTLILHKLLCMSGVLISLGICI